MSVLSGNIGRVVLVLVLVAGSFGAAVILKTQALPRLSGAAAAAEPVRAGAFVFSKPASWHAMGEEHLAKAPGLTNASGTVVAGLCPTVRGSKGCSPDEGIVYVLLQNDGHFPSLVTMRETLDRSLPGTFRSFRLHDAVIEQTLDRGNFLRYEFTFTGSGGKMHQTIGVFRGSKGGAVIVAQGPEQQFARHREALAGMLRSAHEVV